MAVVRDTTMLSNFNVCIAWLTSGMSDKSRHRHLGQTGSTGALCSLSGLTQVRLFFFFSTDSIIVSCLAGLLVEWQGWAGTNILAFFCWLNWRMYVKEEENIVHRNSQTGEERPSSGGLGMKKTDHPIIEDIQEQKKKKENMWFGDNRDPFSLPSPPKPRSTEQEFLQRVLWRWDNLGGDRGEGGLTLWVVPRHGQIGGADKGPLRPLFQMNGPAPLQCCSFCCEWWGSTGTGTWRYSSYSSWRRDNIPHNKQQQKRTPN